MKNISLVAKLKEKEKELEEICIEYRRICEKINDLAIERNTIYDKYRTISKEFEKLKEELEND